MKLFPMDVAFSVSSILQPSQSIKMFLDSFDPADLQDECPSTEQNFINGQIFFRVKKREDIRVIK